MNVRPFILPIAWASLAMATPVWADTQAWDINNSGDVVGQYYDVHQGFSVFIFKSGHYDLLNTFGTGLVGTGINDSGQIVAYGPSNSFLYDQGVFSPIEYPGSIFTTAFGINNDGDIIGYTQSSAHVSESFLYHQGAYTLIDLSPPLPGLTIFYDINDSGVRAGTNAPGATTVLGEHGFIDFGASVTMIDFPGADGTTVMSINNGDAVAGWYTINGVRHGFVDDNGSFTSIDVPGASYTEVDGINDLGWVSGTFIDANGRHGFIDEGGAFTILDFPVPEPAAWLLMALGLGHLGAALRLKRGGWGEPSPA